MKAQWLRAGLLVVIIVAVAPEAQGVPMIDFGIFAPTTGTMTYAGGANPLVGTMLTVDNVVGLNTPQNDGVLRNCISCTFSFTTGNATASTGANWNFAAGGFLRLIGGIDFNGDGDTVDAGDVGLGTTLLSGTFNQPATVSSFFRNFRIAGAGFVDVKDDALARFYGLSGGANVPHVGAFNISFFASALPPSGFASTQVLSGDVVNQPTSGQQVLPVPSTAVLIITGLVWMRGWGRSGRRRPRIATP